MIAVYAAFGLFAFNVLYIVIARTRTVAAASAA